MKPSINKYLEKETRDDFKSTHLPYVLFLTKNNPNVDDIKWADKELLKGIRAKHDIENIWNITPFFTRIVQKEEHKEVCVWRWLAII